MRKRSMLIASTRPWRRNLLLNPPESPSTRRRRRKAKPPVKGKDQAVASQNKLPYQCQGRKFLLKSPLQSWRTLGSSPQSSFTREERGRQNKILQIPQMPRSHHRRLHPPERCNRNAHTTRRAQTVHQELRAEKTSHRAHNRWKRKERGCRHGSRATQYIPRAHGYNSIYVLMGTLPRCQRHHRRYLYALCWKHEEEVWRAAKRQPSGPTRTKTRGRPLLAFYDHKLPEGTPNWAIPLLVQDGMANFDIRRVLIDTWASWNIMYTGLFKTLNLMENKFAPYVGTKLYGFNESSTKPWGYVELLVTFREGKGMKTIKIPFLVIDCTSLYNCIIGRTGLA